MRFSKELKIVFLLSPLYISCQASETPRLIEGSFGIFYGGDVREPSAINLEPTKLPKLGFRLRSSGATSRLRKVSFRLIRPGRTLSRVKEFGDLDWRPQQAQLDHLVPWPEVFRRGYWSLRVTVDDSLVIDRSIYFTGDR